MAETADHETRTVLQRLFPVDTLWGQGPVLRAILGVAALDAAAAALFAGSITVLLVRTTDLSLPAIGAALSIGGACGVLAAVPMGRVADRTGPRIYLVVASLVAAMAHLLFPFVDRIATVAVASGLGGIAVAASWPALQSLIGAAAATEDRSMLLAGVRSARNIGYAVAGLLIGLVLWLPGADGLWVVVGFSAFAYVTSAAVYAMSPAAVVTRTEEPDAKISRPWRDTRYLSLTAASTLFALSMVILDIGFPIWVVESNRLPDYLAGLVLIVNTILVIAFQLKAAELASSLPRARSAIIKSAVVFNGAFVLMATTDAVGPVGVAVVVVVAAAILFTIGEMLESAAWWTISYELAPAERRNEYLALFSLNYQAVAAVGPLLVTASMALGAGSWAVFAALITVAGLATIVLLRGNEQR